MTCKNIYQMSKYYKPYSGGLESVVSDIAENIPCEVTVLASDSEGLIKKEIINSVQVIRSKEYFTLASTPISPGYIWNVIKYSRDCILHVHLPNPLSNIGIYMAWIFKRDISKIVVHWHSDIVKQKMLLKIYKPLQDWLLKKAKFIIVTSEEYLDNSEALIPFKSKCVVIPIGISSMESKVSPKIVEEIKNKYQGKRIIFSLGRHIYYKGFEYLIESALKVENTVFLIGGKGPDTEKYNQMIIKFGLQDKVHLIGRVEDDDLPSYYAAADIFAFPSTEKSEAFGVVQLEAMSVGTPVVSTNIIGSGVPWVNKNENSGLICSVKDSNSLSDSINRILDDEILYDSLSLGAKQRYLDYFTKEKMVEKIEAVYAQM